MSGHNGRKAEEEEEEDFLEEVEAREDLACRRREDFAPGRKRRDMRRDKMKSVIVDTRTYIYNVIRTRMYSVAAPFFFVTEAISC